MNTTGYIRFEYPFSGARNPHEGVVAEGTLAWIRRLRLVSSDRALSKLEATNFGGFAAWLFPSAGLDLLQIISDFTAVVFLLDDEYDDGRIKADPESLAALNERYLGELFGLSKADSSDPVTRGFLDVRDRIRASQSNVIANRWLRDLQYYFEANVWEAENRRRRRVPSVDEYIRLRRFSGSVYPCCDFLEMMLDEPLPLAIAQHPKLRRIREICCDVLCWTNDYYSLQKEIEAGEVHNLVVVLQYSSRSTIEEAIAQLVHMHDSAVVEYEVIKSELLSSPIADRVRAYLEAADALIAGNQEWALAARRYAPRAGSPLVSAST